MSRVTRLINKLAPEAQQEIAVMGLKARQRMKELAEHHNRSRGQINRYIRERALRGTTFKENA